MYFMIPMGVSFISQDSLWLLLSWCVQGMTAHQDNQEDAPNQYDREVEMDPEEALEQRVTEIITQQLIVVLLGLVAQLHHAD